MKAKLTRAEQIESFKKKCPTYFDLKRGAQKMYQELVLALESIDHLRHADPLAADGYMGQSEKRITALLLDLQC